ncbi:hypothetical protein GCM10027168_22220 [Streptomyces capparidis]
MIAYTRRGRPNLGSGISRSRRIPSRRITRSEASLPTWHTLTIRGSGCARNPNRSEASPASVA